MDRHLLLMVVAFLVGITGVLGYQLSKPYPAYPPQLVAFLVSSDGTICALQNSDCMSQLHWVWTAQQPVVELIGAHPRPAVIRPPVIRQEARARSRIKR